MVNYDKIQYTIQVISKALETYTIHNQEEQEDQPAITPNPQANSNPQFTLKLARVKHPHL